MSFAFEFALILQAVTSIGNVASFEFWFFGQQFVQRRINLSTPFGKSLAQFLRDAFDLKSPRARFVSGSRKTEGRGRVRDNRHSRQIFGREEARDFPTPSSGFPPGQTWR